MYKSVEQHRRRPLIVQELIFTIGLSQVVVLPHKERWHVI